MRRLLLCLILLSPIPFFTLEGCTALGLAPAQTFNEKFAYAEASHTAVMQAASNAVTAGQLSSADASKVLSDADNVETVLMAAQSANAAGDAAGANNKLAIATAALTSIQAYLDAHKTVTK
jgi:hypothetical protein